MGIFQTEKINYATEYYTKRGVIIKALSVIKISLVSRFSAQFTTNKRMQCGAYDVGLNYTIIRKCPHFMKI